MSSKSQVQPDIAASPATRQWAKSPFLYIGLIAVTAALVALALKFGSNLVDSAPESGAANATKQAKLDIVPKVLLALPVILLVCHVTALAFKRIGQPAVIGEIFAGIMLGPSLLGLVWPAAYAWLFPPVLIPVINVLAQIGLVFFMFLIGYELNLRYLKGRGYTAMVVSHVSIALPFLSGIVLAVVMYHSFAPAKVGFTAFALFLAVAMSITAFPVLARILTDRKLDGTPLGAMALTCAAIDDVTAWCLLAVVVAIAHSSTFDGVIQTLVLSAAFFLLMVFVVRPLLARVTATIERTKRPVSKTVVLAVVLSGIMLSALATDMIGIHAIFGAFLFGVIMPRESDTVEQATTRMRDVTTTLLLPLFFVYVGLRTKFGLLGTDWALWGWCLVIMAVAIMGKWGGSTAAARVTGLDWRQSLSLGALMSCRGLTELVVLNIGLDLGVISPTMFAMLVIMALVSTAMTSPALTVIERLTGRVKERARVPAAAAD